jgi:hypothetical protein
LNIGFQRQVVARMAIRCNRRVARGLGVTPI